MVSGVDPMAVFCSNRSTRQTVRIALDPGVRSWNCGDSGLVVNTPSSNLFLKRSPDKGQTWLPSGIPIRIKALVLSKVRTPDEHMHVPDAAFDVAVDSAEGTLYAVWRLPLFGGSPGIALSQSSDGGFTWTSPIRVNQTPSIGGPLMQQAFLPSVAASNGMVAVTYYDFRNDDETGELADYFVALCRENCSDPASWANEIRLTENSFDLNLLPDKRRRFLGDYVGLASDGVDFLSVFPRSISETDPASLFFRRIVP
jgi:hypothetical protein